MQRVGRELKGVVQRCADHELLRTSTFRAVGPAQPTEGTRVGEAGAGAVLNVVYIGACVCVGACRHIAVGGHAGRGRGEGCGGSTCCVRVECGPRRE